MPTTIKPPKKTGGTTHTAGNGIALSGDEFSSKTDGTTLTNTGGGSSDALAVLKVPGTLSVAGSLSLSASGYDGSGDVTITGGTIPGSSTNVQFNALGVNVANTSTGTIVATGDITAFSSDKRLKTNIVPIQEPLSKLSTISGYNYRWNMDKCNQVGFKPVDIPEVGVLAQEINEVLPEAIKQAPFDRDKDGNSASGDKYLTVQYEKIVPLLIECIKAQQSQIDELKVCLSKLK